MIRTGDSAAQLARQVNRQGARGGFQRNEIVSLRFPVPGSRPRGLIYGSPTPTPAQMFAIRALSNADYYVARTFDGTNLGATDVYLAKPARLRPSVAAEVIDGVGITYSSYTADNARTASDGTNTEFQVVFPRFTAYATAPSGVDDLAVVFAVPVVNGTGVMAGSAPVTWLEISPARVWARRFNP